MTGRSGVRASHGVSRRAVLALAIAAPLGAPARAVAGPGRRVDRVVARFHAPELGGAAQPRFVTERELAFETRLEALTGGWRGAGTFAYRERDVRAALERHVAETLLASARIDPEPSAQLVTSQTAVARELLEHRVGGAPRLAAAAAAEGMAERDVLRVLRRQARAALYLDRMVEPMLAPTEALLRALHEDRRTPFGGQPWAPVREATRRWWVSRRLAAALVRYFRNARSRVTLVVVTA
ncbi:MAG: hypothetical protein IT376_09725 [Polyangiaceae bacterium]|nr:hypothetical protein [Polyangiaceae bacterium]